MRRPGFLLTAALALTAFAATLTGCAPAVSLTPAADANNPACASVIVRVPKVIDTLSRVWTDAQGTAAWGTPSAVILACGGTSPAASELPCQTVNGVDWLVDDSKDPLFRFTTFGRKPAVTVLINYKQIGARDTLSALATAVNTLPKTDVVCSAKPAG